MKEIEFRPKSEGIEKGLLILRHIIAPLEHGIPFTLIIDYDPGKDRAYVKLEVPGESLERYNHLRREYSLAQDWHQASSQTHHDALPQDRQDNQAD